MNNKIIITLSYCLLFLKRYYLNSASGDNPCSPWIHRLSLVNFFIELLVSLMKQLQRALKMNSLHQEDINQLRASSCRRLVKKTATVRTGLQVFIFLCAPNPWRFSEMNFTQLEIPIRLTFRTICSRGETARSAVFSQRCYRRSWASEFLSQKTGQ